MACVMADDEVHTSEEAKRRLLGLVGFGR